jgi:RHH-type proline utilization regulon transcriptional repressor/proline dehydrogenase/delta 1-pyrroline-5-carboxylate dehydrogenase
VVGPGAKAGGPNYVASLGTWPVVSRDVDLAEYTAGCQAAWAAMRVPEDPTGLAAEANAFRYRPLHSVLLHRGAAVTDAEVACARAAAAATGVRVVGTPQTGIEKVRFLGEVDDSTRLWAHDEGWWVDDIPVAADPARELLRWVREQAVSERLHRHGNITGRRRGLGR